jgi:hypothetical protein
VICEELAAVREPMPGNGLAGLPRRAPVTSEGANPVSLMCGNWENCRILHFDGIWSDSRYKAPRQRRYRAGRCHNNHDVLHMKASYA